MPPNGPQKVENLLLYFLTQQIASLDDIYDVNIAPHSNIYLIIIQKTAINLIRTLSLVLSFR